MRREMRKMRIDNPNDEHKKEGNAARERKRAVLTGRQQRQQQREGESRRRRRRCDRGSRERVIRSISSLFPTAIRRVANAIAACCLVTMAVPTLDALVCSSLHRQVLALINYYQIDPAAVPTVSLMESIVLIIVALDN